MAFGHTYYHFDSDGKYRGYVELEPQPGLTEAKISVILPVYNAEKYLDQALDSILSQSHENLEVICVNDGSTDGSLAIMQAHAERDPRVVVIDKENEGYGASCNRGLDRATGEWISIIEPDDWIDGDMYASMLEFASGVPGDFDIIKTPYWRIMDADTPKEKRYACSYKRLVKPKKQPFAVTDAIHLLNHHPSIWSALYRKSFLDEKNIRFKPIPGAGWADNPFLIETLCQARGIVYLDEAFYCYRADDEAKERDFSQANPRIPFDRWDEMTDIIEGLGIEDERILSAHYNRGIMYMSGVIMHNDPDSPEMRELLERMFARMKPELVFANDRISPGCKRLYAEVRGIEDPKFSSVGYGINLAGQALYNLRNNGPGEMVHTVGKYLRTHKDRTGGR